MPKHEQVSDAILGSMIRQILKDCPEFTITRITDSRDPNWVGEVGATPRWAGEYTKNSQDKIFAALKRIATLHQQHISERTEDEQA